MISVLKSVPITILNWSLRFTTKAKVLPDIRQAVLYNLILGRMHKKNIFLINVISKRVNLCQMICLHLSILGCWTSAFQLSWSGPTWAVEYDICILSSFFCLAVVVPLKACLAPVLLATRTRVFWDMLPSIYKCNKKVRKAMISYKKKIIANQIFWSFHAEEPIAE